MSGLREREKALEQLIGTVEVFAQAGIQRPRLRRHAAGLGDCHIQCGAHHGQRGAELVRGVGHEQSLRVKRRFEPRQKTVDRVGEVFEFVPRTRQG